MRKIVICSTGLVLVLLVAAASSPVLAVCPGGLFQPLQHFLGGYFKNCPDRTPVKAFAYALSTGVTPDITCPTAASCNSANLDIVCEDANTQTGQGSSCQAEAGTAGDGNVTVLFDWGGPGAYPGCPDPNQQINIGRNFLQVVANDGSSIMVSVGFSFDLLAYTVDFAEGDTLPPPPLSCTTSEAGLRVASYDGTNLCGNVPVPVVHTDCDPGVWGLTGGGGTFQPTCNSAFPVPSTSRGKLYRKDDICGTSPDMALTSGWTLLPVTPDATGNFCVPVPRPTAPNTCAFIGASGLVAGGETPALLGTAQIAGQNAPSARALDVRASTAGGNVVITFRTESELDLGGFNILTDSQGGKNRLTVNSGMIAGKGVAGAGAKYEVRIPRGNFKGGKNAYVETVLTSGARIVSDPASF